MSVTTKGTPISEQPTLRALLRQSDLHLRLVTAEGALPAGTLDRPLRWVHSSDLSDPTPFLADDLVLLTTGTQFAGRGPAHQIAYIARLAKRGIAGLGFGRDVALPEIPAALLRACADAGIPLFEVPYATPFIAIARTHAELIGHGAGGQAATEQQRDLYAQLITSLLLGDPALAERVLASLAVSPQARGRMRPSGPGALARMLDHETARTTASALLTPLGGTGLEDTLRLWLDHDARLEPAAEALGIHRHTLRTRIARAAKLLNRDLSTFPARAEVWAALQAGGEGVIHRSTG